MNIEKLIVNLIKNLEIQSILCYGSYAHGLNDDKSDIDLLILVKKEIPTNDIRKRVYASIKNIEVLVIEKNMANWDVSWSPVNDKIIMNNQLIEIGYNTVSWADTVVNKLVVKNQITFPEFPFRPYTFLGLLENSKILYDKDDFIINYLDRIKPMPEKLREEIINEFLPILEESYDELRDYAVRDIGILAYQFQLSRGIDAIVSLLFAVNDMYDPATKRVEPFLFKLKKQPLHLKEFITHVLPRFYEHKSEVIAFFKTCLDFTENNRN